MNKAVEGSLNGLSKQVEGVLLVVFPAGICFLLVVIKLSRT